MLVFSAYIILNFLKLYMCQGVSYPKDEQLYEGSKCTHTSGVEGVCKLYSECPEVLLQKPKENTCTYVGYDPIWCCPTEDERKIIRNLDPMTEFDCGIRTIGISSRQSITLNRTFIPVPNIVGGSNAILNSWPWAVLLGEMSDPRSPVWFCGGSLINENWVLTAAHCMKSGEVVARLGEHNFSDPFDGAIHRDVMIVEEIIYPEYNSLESYHDLALLRLQTPVEFNVRISPICLPQTQNIPSGSLIGEELTVIGWGASEFLGRLSEILMEAQLTVVPNSICEEGYSQLPSYSTDFPRGISDEPLICARDPDGEADSCTGDSGGPILMRLNESYIQVGIVSVGYGCGNEDFPGIYTNLFYQPYIDWIQQVAFSEQ